MFSIKEISEFVRHTIENLSFTEEPNPLYSPVEYTLSLGGKRMRPMLCVLAYNMYSNQIDASILLPAAGLEIFHNFTLIHDDIMDASPIRRGQATVYKKWDVNTAILSGDAMCIKAYHYISQCAPQYLPSVLSVFNRTAAQVCEGQALDMTYENQAVITEKEYLDMIGLKTAVLTACATYTGSLCGGASETEAQLMYRFGYALGMGFQIQDDLLDAFGSAALFGKTIGSDISNNKKTWLLVYALSKATGEDLKTLQYCLRNNSLNESEKVHTVLQIYRNIRVQAAAENRIQEFHSEAMGILDAIKLDEANKTVMREYLLSLLNRSK